MRIAVILGACLVLIMVGWVWGVLTFRERVFPYDLAVDVWLWIKKEREAEEAAALSVVLPQDPGFLDELIRDGRRQSRSSYATVKARHTDLLSSMRSKLLLPSSLLRVYRVEEREDRTIVRASFYGIQVDWLLQRARDGKNCLVAYFQGHSGNPLRSDEQYQLQSGVIERGCDMISFSMLGIGLNAGLHSFPSSIYRGEGNITLTERDAHIHANYASYFDGRFPDVDPIALFIYGHYAILQEILGDYRSIKMTGISGGGWMVVLLAPFLPQVDHTIAVAGTAPLYLRQRAQNLGDYEEYFAPFWRSADYWDFYFLATMKEDGKQTRDLTLVYNTRDPCCFGEPTGTIMAAVLDEFPRIDVVNLEKSEHVIDVDFVLNRFFGP